MTNENDGKTPNEIPNKNTPHTPEPLKDPATPGEDNPVNPKTDESTNQGNI